MGSQESKAEQPVQQKSSPIKGTIGGTVSSSPILTPLDPRSPSENVSRTPLTLFLESQDVEDSITEQEGESDENIKDVEIENVVLGIDPRSPTVEFNRTPIIVATKAKYTKVQNKILDNVCKSEIQTTPVTNIRKSSNIVPPKVLDSSPVSLISNYKRKSFVGLLETNLDFTETDLDMVCQVKNASNNTLPEEVIEDLLNNEVKEEMENLQIESSPNMTPELSQTPEVQEQEIKLLIDKVFTEKVINITAQVKDFDKKLTNLIYEDSDNTLSPRSIKIKENNRTPLGTRNSNDDSKKKNRLKVSDKPRKSEISRIPVFKDHCRRAAVQCENTPPTKLENSHKMKISQWDADKTLII